MKLFQCLVVMLSLLLAINHAYAQTVLESKAVTKSDYFTGKSGKAKVHYISLSDWLSFRSQDDLPKDIYNRGFLIDDPKVVGSLYEVTNRLLKNWPGTVPKIGIFVRVDTMASTYGAEALIANEILIYYGTLINIESDDELAAIIAHELAHILLGDNAKANYVNIAKQLLSDYEGVKNLHDTVKAGHVVETADKKYSLTFDEGLQDDIVKASEQKDQAAEVYYAYHGSLLGKPAETRADLLATDLLIAAGYSPLGLHDTLGKLASSFTVQKFVSDSLVKSSNEIMKAVKLSMDEQVKGFNNELKSAVANGSADFSSLPSSLSFSNFTSSVGGRLKKSLKSFAWSRFKSPHPVSKNRISKLVDYLDNNYSLRLRQKRKSTKMLKQYRRSGIDAMASYKKIELASLQLIEGNIDKAASQSIAALMGASDADPFKRYTAHRIRRDQNRMSSAMTNIEKIKDFQSVPSYAMVEMLDLLVENKRLSGATRMIEAKEQYGYVVPQFYPSKIAIALARDNKENARLLAGQCIASKQSEKNIKRRCKEFGLLADASAGGIFGGIKNATSSFTDTLNPINK